MPGALRCHAGAETTGQLAREARCALYASQGGRNLQHEGLAGDIPAAAEIDYFDFVPTLALTTWTIRKPG